MPDIHTTNRDPAIGDNVLVSGRNEIGKVVALHKSRNGKITGISVMLAHYVAVDNATVVEGGS